MEHWYLIYTQARREEEAANQLQRQGFDIYLPRLESEKRVRGRWSKVIEPLFPRYLFVKVDPQQHSIAPIRSTIGVSNMVRFGASLCRVPEGIVNYLKAREDKERQVIVANNPRFIPGGYVEIIAGPFSGLTAIFKQAKGSDRALVLLEMLGSLKAITFHQNELVPVT